MIPSNSTLAEIAVHQPTATRIFMRHGLDFCCHGQRSLEEACAEKGVDADLVAAELAADEPRSASELRWADRPLKEIIDFILVRYHASLRRDLPTLVELARKVELVHAEKPDCPRGLTRHLSAIAADVESHLQKEELMLFPAIESGAHAMALMPIKVMMEEHVDHGENLRRTREMTSDLVPPPEACTTWRALYAGLARLEAELMEHIHLENNVLFPRTLGLSS